MKLAGEMGNVSPGMVLLIWKNGVLDIDALWTSTGWLNIGSHRHRHLCPARAIVEDAECA